MSQDRWIYYDFSSEKELKNWINITKNEDLFSFDMPFTCEEDGEYILLAPESNSAPDKWDPCLESLTVDGKSFRIPDDLDPYFIGKTGSRNGLFLTLKKGEHLLQGKGSTSVDNPEDFITLSLIKNPLCKVEGKPGRVFSYTVEKEYTEQEQVEENVLLSSYKPGVGCTEVPGRFGFVKGDGVLDYTMFTLGTASKMYMTGHPRYKKPFLWHYSTFPEGGDAYHGSIPPARNGIEKDEVRVNHLSCTWKSRLNGKRFSCTYSLASPALITECEDGKMCLSHLEYAGNYQYVLFSSRNGSVKVVPLADFSVEDMAENFILLFSCTEFPDLPLLLVFQKKPENFSVQYNEKNNRLSRILMENCPLLFSATPFGIESFDPIAPDDESFIKRSIRLCRFWSRAFLAYPIRCEEYYKLDEVHKTTEILQKFSYRYIRDDWGTVPLELAPVPPVAQLSGLLRTEAMEDFCFPAQMGPLKGRRGKYCTYTLPWMPESRKFPLKDSETDLPEILKEGYDEYFSFVKKFPPPFQSYPYAGAFLEPYAFTSALTHFLSAEDQAALREKLSGALSFICDGEATGNYTAIRFAQIMRSQPENEDLLKIYADPELRHLSLKLWNTRKEPFTGREYTICYLNLSYFTANILKTGSREEIKNLSKPLIENDWGLGLTFYYLYLAVLATGELTAVKKNFPILKSAFHFFEIFHDWACMGSGYSENGVTWCEGANYGAFTAYTQLCELLSEKEDLALARYYSSKQFALRMGIFRASRYYFCKYFGIPPYDVCQSFREGNQIYGQYLCAPGDVEEYGYRPYTVYKMTTEGLYGELFESAERFFPEDWERVRASVGRNLHELPEGTPADWNVLEPSGVYLMSLALDEKVPSAFFEKELARIKERGFLMQRWRGIHIFSRRLPQNAWEVQLRAWNEMKKHPLWLTLWKNTIILSAEWTGKEARITLEINEKTFADRESFLRLGYRRKPERITFNGKDADFTCDETGQTIQISLPASGVLVCEYGK